MTLTLFVTFLRWYHPHHFFFSSDQQLVHLWSDQQREQTISLRDWRGGSQTKGHSAAHWRDLHSQRSSSTTQAVPNQTHEVSSKVNIYEVKDCSIWTFESIFFLLESDCSSLCSTAQSQKGDWQRSRLPQVHDPRQALPPQPAPQFPPPASQLRLEGSPPILWPPPLLLLTVRMASLRRSKCVFYCVFLCDNSYPVAWYSCFCCSHSLILCNPLFMVFYIHCEI